MDSDEEVQSNENSKTQSGSDKRKFRPKQENVKRGRLFIRNLPFKITEEKLTEEFQKFGAVKEVILLKKPDGKLVGCGFIQFENYDDSVKAVKAWNGKPLLGRKIVVEFALSKNRFQHQHPEKVKEVKKDEEKSEKVEDENESEDDEEEEKNEEKNEDENEEDSGLENEDEEKDMEELKKEKVEEKPVMQPNKYKEDDHEYTVFLKNVSFDSTDENLREHFKQYGPIKYALVVRDPVSKHSKGTAFVRFLKKESVELCLKQSGKILLQNCLLEILPSLPKKKIQELENDKKKEEPKDGRNLYLLREGMIHAGSAAAEGVSASDMATRLRLEQVKSQMLKNLVRFIARDRLTFHNLPETIDNDKLKKLVISRTKIRPIECRVMRENKPSPGHPLGKSKGHAFLSFKSHEEALTVLRKLNNNPSIFSPKKRPIVSFSIEDKNILNIKAKRMERSKMSNPTYQKKTADRKLKRAEKRKMEDKKDKKPSLKVQPKKKSPLEVPEVSEKFAGFESKKGNIAKLRGTFKLKEQSKIHEKSMQERNKLLKREKMQQIIRAEKDEKKLDKASRKRKLHNESKDDLSKMINKYKKMIGGASTSGVSTSTDKQTRTRGKWFMEG